MLTCTHTVHNHPPYVYSFIIVYNLEFLFMLLAAGSFYIIYIIFIQTPVYHPDCCLLVSFMWFILRALKNVPCVNSQLCILIGRCPGKSSWSELLVIEDDTVLYESVIPDNLQRWICDMLSLSKGTINTRSIDIVSSVTSDLWP